MLRLCSESSRSYPGRSALHALSFFCNKFRLGPYRETKVQASPAVADGVTVAQFPDAFRDLWPQIRSNLFEGTYSPNTYGRSPGRATFSIVSEYPSR